VAGKSKRASKRDPQRTNGKVRTVVPPAKASANGDAKSATARLSKPRAPKPTHPCVCGCGAPTKRVFAPGHDAKVYAILRRVRDGKAKQSDVPKGVRGDKALLTHLLAHVS
jgi:hypothetical protein